MRPKPDPSRGHTVPPPPLQLIRPPASAPPLPKPFSGRLVPMPPPQPQPPPNKRNKENTMNPNDEIRMQILRYFYDRNHCATSRFGKKGSALKISVAKSELKDRNGLTQAQVMSNMTYLIDQGWVNTFDIEKTIMVKGGTVP